MKINTKCPEHKLRELHKRIYNFVYDLKKRWTKSNRKIERFLSNNQAWLDTSIGFPMYGIANKSHEYFNVGRPKTIFSELSERTKRHATQKLRSQHSPDELCYAAQMSPRSSKKVEASKLVKEVTETTPKRAARYRAAFKACTASNRTQLSPEEAVSMFVEAKLTRHQYYIVRLKDKLRFPSYKIIQQAKQDCYPDKDQITITDTSADIKLQALLDHTSSRLIQVQKDVLSNLENIRLLFDYKMGF